MAQGPSLFQITEDKKQSISSVMAYIDKINKQMPGMVKKISVAVNAEVKKKVKQEARSRGYKATHAQSWGDSGYQKGLKSWADNKFNAKVFFTKDSFIYNFIEFGADVKPRTAKYLVFEVDGQFYKSEGFSYPARPLLYPIADSIWKSSRAMKIADQRLQKELNKLDKKGGK